MLHSLAGPFFSPRLLLSLYFPCFYVEGSRLSTEEDDTFCRNREKTSSALFFAKKQATGNGDRFGGTASTTT